MPYSPYVGVSESGSERTVDRKQSSLLSGLSRAYRGTHRTLQRKEATQSGTRSLSQALGGSGSTSSAVGQRATSGGFGTTATGSSSYPSAQTQAGLDQVVSVLDEMLSKGTPGTSAGGKSGSPTAKVGGDGAKTAFGKSFAPGSYEELWANPEALIQHYFNWRGMNSKSGMLPVMQEHADNLGLLWMASKAGSPSMGSAAEFADWSGNYMNQMLRPGGKYMTPHELMNAILNPHKDSAFYQQFNSAMLKPADQVDNVLQAVRYGLEGTVPAPMLSAILSRINYHGNQFIAWRMTRQDGGSSFTDYLGQQGVDAKHFGY